MLKIKNLRVKVDNKNILNNISFTFQKGKIYVLMGPNGSGKTTLAFAIMGHPLYKLSPSSKIIFNGKNLGKLSPEKRAKLGLFLSFQSPLALSGVNIFQVLRYALQKKLDPLNLKEKLENLVEKLKLKKEFLERPLNEGFSGGEKKKMEILQAVVLDPKFLIFDEIDTGIDIDALKTIGQFLGEFKKKKKTMLLITHYNRILKYLKADVILVMKDGSIVKVGGQELAKKIEREGYEKI